MELPGELQAALADALATTSPKQLTQSTATVSQRYRAAQPLAQGSFLRSHEDILAYAAYRLPATYAAVRSALGQVKAARPGWHPRSILDVGAGLGSVLWAATDVWPDLAQLTAFERDERMSALGREFASHAPSRAIRDAAWVRVDLLGPWQQGQADLVVASYVLGELPPAGWPALLAKLWSTSTGVLVIVEPGTPRGFTLIRHVRAQAIEAGAHAIAPCPHDDACPIQGDDWCHFAQRVARTTLHRQAKTADLSYEDEKFSYVALSREPGLPIRGRILRHPQTRPGYISLRLCTPQGITTSVVTRKDRDAYRQARDAHWGSSI